MAIIKIKWKEGINQWVEKYGYDSNRRIIFKGRDSAYRNIKEKDCWLNAAECGSLKWDKFFKKVAQRNYIWIKRCVEITFDSRDDSFEIDNYIAFWVAASVYEWRE